MLYHVTLAGHTFRVEVDQTTVHVDDVELTDVTLAQIAGTSVRHLLASGATTIVVAQRDNDGWSMLVDGWPVQAEVIDERTRAIREMTGRTHVTHGPRPVRAPMPGLIVRIDVGVGDAVRAGQGVVAMEAMKMENELKAESAGVVSRILVEPGQAVEKGTVLVELSGDGGMISTATEA
jgi:pyruvate carboxylase subunit B